MVRRIMALAATAGCMGVSAVTLDRSVGRVASPLEVDMEWIGTVRPRSVGEIAGSNWRLGCEVLDRDFADFEEYKDFVEPLGIRLVRLQGGWAKCEKRKGVYDFAWLDRIVDYLRARGVDCAIETGYGNPIYKGGGTVDLAAGFPTGEEALAGWDGWVRALATHFKGRVDTFMMWNEPDLPPADGSPAKTPAEIAAFNIRTAKTIRSVIPHARLGGLSLAYCDAEPFEACLKAMGEDIRLFETFIYHGYKPAPESSYPQVEKLKTVLAKYHPAARMWQGENGCPSEMAFVFSLNGIPWSEYSQAKWDMRRMLGDLGHDVLSSVFTICDFNHKGREINLKGLLRADERKKVIAVKRAYYAVQNVVSVFDDTLVRVHGSGWDKGFGTKDRTIVTYEYLKNARMPVFAFWSCAETCNKEDPKVSFIPPGASFGLRYVRPGESFETRPMVFRYNGNAPALVDPVWIDLLTGRVYAFPKKNVVIGQDYVRYLDVPVYDSPCLLCDRAAVDMVSR